MSISRKMIREQVRKNIKQAKQSVPAEYRDAITFSSVFNMVKKKSVEDARMSVRAPQEELKEETEVKDEGTVTEQKFDI